MNWTNVKLILQREVRDQLRDRRTMFMIFVLPLLLYPLLGMSMMQVAQFVREHATRVLVIGRESLPEKPELIVADRFAERLFVDPEKVDLLELTFEAPGFSPDMTEEQIAQRARAAVESGEFEAVVFVPSDFGARLAAFRDKLRDSPTAGHDMSDVPSPEIYFSTAKEKSQLAYIRVEQVLDHWTQEIVRDNLARRNVPESAVKPFTLAEHDVADADHRQAAIWSKILPFLLLIWALTGAFYPAIDLCAGEKERGTLETLLSSPAERGEIVWGKLLTIMVFSVVTAVLNILSMAFTGALVVAQLPELGPPPVLAPLWLLLALLPVAALFSALCLALAAFARSTKEGQYYLMPLVLVTMPLVILPMAPGVELSLGNSLIPLCGVVLLLRSMLEGDYMAALPYVLPVLVVTLGCCVLAVRWAIDQFNSEDVLFRASERLDLGLWLRSLLRDRNDTPSVAMAVFCGVLILMINFFMNFALTAPDDYADLIRLALVTQLVVVATPALLMTIMLTRSARMTLLLNRPPWGGIAMGVIAALLVAPLANQLAIWVQELYPASDSVAEFFGRLGTNPIPLWQMILALAVMPAVCEELAFRGFILSGMRRMGHRWRAIAVASLFFGISHGVVQQSLLATLLGLLIGYIAVQTNSIFPAMAFHATHNSLALAPTRVTADVLEQWPVLRWLGNGMPSGGIEYHDTVVVLSGVALAAAVYWFRRLPSAPTREESIVSAIAHESPAGVVS